MKATLRLRARQHLHKVALIAYSVESFCAFQLAAANFAVTASNDSGPGSLRQAILDANAAGGGTIVASNGTGTIVLASALPSFDRRITLQGPGPSLLSVSGNHTQRVFSVSSNATVWLSGLTICNGTEMFGAGVQSLGSLTISNCVLSNNISSQCGGAIDNSGDLKLFTCSLVGNQAAATNAEGYGGGLYTSSGNVVISNCTISGNQAITRFIPNDHFLYIQSGVSCLGGGIYISGGKVAIQGTLLYGNSAFGGAAPSSSTPSHGAGGGGSGSGGALYLGSGTLSMVNSTVSSNQTIGGTGGGYGFTRGCFGGPGGSGDGSGVHISSGTATVVNCTVVFNTGRNGPHGPDMCSWPPGGVSRGGICNYGGNLSLLNTIVAQNNVGAPSQPDIFGSYTNTGYNLIGGDPRLNPLQDNGGPTWTHVPQCDSPAIDTGTLAGAPSIDQQGNPRPQGQGTDIGAFEAEPSQPVITAFPTNLIVPVGMDVKLSVAASGSCPISYQWRKGGVTMPGETAPWLMLYNLQSSHEGDYMLVLSNFMGVITSAVVNVKVTPAPGILNHPQSMAILPGQDASFSVVAFGQPPLSFQWQFNGINIPGATAATYLAHSVQESNAGDYQVLVQNAFGAVTSRVAALTIAPMFLVTHNQDSGPGSLRQAITDANALPVGRVGFSNVTGTITLASPLPSLSGKVGLYGPGPNNLAVNGDNKMRVFSVASRAYAFISGLSVRNGLGANNSRGGGILNQGTLMLTNCTVVQNQTIGGFGAGICNEGSLTLINSMVISNAAIGGAGGTGTYYGGGGGGGAGMGGGLYAATGDVRLINCTFSGNLAQGGNGGKVTSGYGTIGVGGDPNGAPEQSRGGFGGGGGGGSYAIGPWPGFPYPTSGGAGGFGGGGGGGGYYSFSGAGGGKGGYGAGIGGGYNTNSSAGGPGGGGGGAGLGGGIFVETSQLSMLGCGFAQNQVLGGAGGIAPNIGTNGSGVAADIFNYAGNVILSNTPVTSTESFPPMFLSYPANQSVLVGQGFSLQIVVASTPPYSLQWRIDGVDIPGEVNSTLTISSAQPLNAGNYTLVASNSSGSVTSAVATVVVGYSFTVSTQGEGIVSRVPDQSIYPLGTQVTLTAIPDAGSGFNGWSEDASGFANPLVFVVDRSKTITAHFASVPRFVFGPSATGMVKEGFRGSLFGKSGDRYLIETSADCTTWTGAFNLTNQNGTAQFIDPFATNTWGRFYRARLLP